MELLATIDSLLHEAEVPAKAIDAIAVDTGPGGYGGLRGGVGIAQGLAVGLDVPLAGVSRLEADAYRYLLRLPPGRPVVAVHDAGHVGIAWAAYELAEPGTAPRLLSGPTIEAAPDAVRHAPPHALWCGELTEALRAALAEPARGDRANDLGAVTHPPGAIAALGLEPNPTELTEDPKLESDETLARSASDLVRLAMLHGSYGDPALVDVVYLRPPSVTLRDARQMSR